MKNNKENIRYHDGKNTWSQSLSSLKKGDKFKFCNDFKIRNNPNEYIYRGYKYEPLYTAGRVQKVRTYYFYDHLHNSKNSTYINFQVYKI